MVATNSRFRVKRDLVARRRYRQQHRQFHVAEMFKRSPLRGAVNTHAGVFEAPAAHADARRIEVAEVLAREPTLTAIRDNSLDPRLIPRAPHPACVNHKAPRLRVLQEGRVEMRVDGVGLEDDCLDVVDDCHAEDATEESPRLFEPFDDLFQRLAEGRPAELMPAHASRENEALDDAPRRAMADQSQASEVDLQFVARFTVVDRNCGSAIAESHLGDAETMQRPVWHHHAESPEQDLDLGQTDTGIQLLLDKRALTVERGPTLPAP